MSFGGPSWPISIDDLNLGTIGGGQCLGAIFDVTQGTDISSQGTPAWIVGDTFLVRVFSFFFVRFALVPGALTYPSTKP